MAQRLKCCVQCMGLRWSQTTPSYFLTRPLHVHAIKKLPQNVSKYTNYRASVMQVPVRSKYLDARDEDHEEKEKELIKFSGTYFDAASKKKKDKETFVVAVSKYLDHQKVQRRGHVEFIYSSLDHMMQFQVHRDIEVYRQILDLFPKKKMIAESVWQVEMMHYPKQQQCCIDILDQMEENGVIPDDQMGYQLIEIFGKKSHAFRKYQRMMYWLPKFKFANPYYIPYDLPDSHEELAKIALKRMSVDEDTKINVFHSEDLDPDCVLDKTFIASAMSPEQESLLCDHPRDKALYVEGGFTTWLRSCGLIYFTLRSDVSQVYKTFHATPVDEDDTKFNWNIFDSDEPSAVVQPPSVHEQSDGTILGMCITGTGSKDSLASWIKCLEQRNPILAQVPVVFLLRTPDTGIQMYKVDESGESKVVMTGAGFGDS